MGDLKPILESTMRAQGDFYFITAYKNIIYKETIEFFYEAAKEIKTINFGNINSIQNNIQKIADGILESWHTVFGGAAYKELKSCKNYQEFEKIMQRVKINIPKDKSHNLTPKLIDYIIKMGKNLSAETKFSSELIYINKGTSRYGLLIEELRGQLKELSYKGKGGERIGFTAHGLMYAPKRLTDLLKATSQTVQRMALKKEDVETAAKSTVAAMGALQAAKFLATLPVDEAVATIGLGDVAAIAVGEFIVVYAGTRCIINNTKTGQKLDVFMTNSMEKIFWSHFYKAQDVLVKKPPAERERLEKKARENLGEFLDEIGVSATKFVLYANLPRKTSRKK